jgi:hypothetical protein
MRTVVDTYCPLLKDSQENLGCEVVVMSGHLGIAESAEFRVAARQESEERMLPNPE